MLSVVSAGRIGSGRFVSSDDGDVLLSPPPTPPHRGDCCCCCCMLPGALPTHTLTQSFTQMLTHSLGYSISFSCSMTHSFTLILPRRCSLIHLVTQSHSFTYTFFHLDAHSLIWLFNHSLTWTLIQRVFQSHIITALYLLILSWLRWHAGQVISCS